MTGEDDDPKPSFSEMLASSARAKWHGDAFCLSATEEEFQCGALDQIGGVSKTTEVAPPAAKQCKRPSVTV
jgi:hypothetical protein